MKPRRKPPARHEDRQGLEQFVDRHRLLIIIAVMLLGLFLRASDLRADPPADLSWSFAPYTDEALNTYSARCLVLHGSWKIDDFFPFVVYPLVNMLVAVLFRLFGIGMVQMKLLSVISGTIGVLIIYLLVKESSGSLAGLLAGLGYAACYPLVMYSRLGLIETVQILFLLCCGLFWSKGLVRPGFMALAGFFAAGTVLLVKISALFIAPVMLTLFLWELLARPRAACHSKDQMTRALLWFAAGAAVAGLVWLLLVFLPHRADYIRYVQRHSFESPQGHPAGLAAYLYNTFAIGAQARLLARLPLVALLGFAALPFWLTQSRTATTTKPRAGMRFLFCWLVFGALMLGYMNYRPPRYEIVLLPTLIACFATVIAEIANTGTLLPATHPTITKTILYSMWLWPLALQLLLKPSLFLAYRHPEIPPYLRPEALLFKALLLAAAASAVGYLISRALKSGLHVKMQAGRLMLAASLLSISLGTDFSQFSSWFSNRTHNLFNWSRELERTLPERAVVAGAWAPTFITETRKRAVAVSDWANISDPIRRFGVTHLILGRNQTDRDLADSIGSRLLEQSTLIRRYTVQNQTGVQELLLLKLPTAD